MRKSRKLIVVVAAALAALVSRSGVAFRACQVLVLRAARLMTGLIAGLALAGALVAPATASASMETNIGKPFAEFDYDVYPVAKPRDLFVAGPRGDLADSIHLRRTHWSSWGGAVAKATARFRYRTYEPWERMRVRAYRPRVCNFPETDDFYAASFRLYTRVKVSSVAGSWTHTWKAPHCNDLTALGPS